MSNSVFPALPGMDFAVVKTPIFNTNIQRSPSLREVRCAHAVYPLYRWQLSFNVLRDRNASDEFRQLMGFYLARQGAFDDFLYDDPTDDSVSAQTIGTGNNSTKDFQLQRTLGAWTDPVLDIQASPAPKIYLDGSLQLSGYTIGTTKSGVLSFTSAPGNNVAITATFKYYFRVRFDEMAEGQDGFTYFMYQMWNVGRISFVSAR